MIDLDEFNGLADDAVRHALRACCTSSRWVVDVAVGRPYRSFDLLLAASDAAVGRLGEVDLREALAGHPKLGDRRAPAVDGQASSIGAEWSSQEQAGVSGADAAARRALAEGNAEYEARFGHIYLACATGRDAAELLTFLLERLDNDRETERSVVAIELAKINQIRLRRLFGVAERGNCVAGGAADTAVAGG